MTNDMPDMPTPRPAKTRGIPLVIGAALGWLVNAAIFEAELKGGGEVIQLSDSDLAALADKTKPKDL